MTKIKFTAVIFATLIFGASTSLNAQTNGTAPSQILLDQLNNQVNGVVVPGEVANQIAPGPIDRGGVYTPAVSATPTQYTPYIAPQASGAVGPTTGSSVQNPVYAPENVQLGETYFQEDAGNFATGQRGPLRRLLYADGQNRVWGVNGLLLSRENFNDGVQVANGLFTGDVTQEDAGGIDINVVTRGGNGKGWEVRYFGLFEDTVAQEVAPSATTLTGLTNINTVFGTGLNLVNLPGNIHSLSSTSNFHNVEFNLLRQRRNRFLGFLPVNMNESIYGFRYMQFNESLAYGTSTAFVSNNQLVHSVENSLLAFQLGRRIEKNLFGRVGIFGFGKLGVYNNNAQARRTFTVNDNTGLVLDTGQDFSDTKNDVAFLGELDLGGTYKFNQRFRAKVGYRMLAASGLAIADGQINNDFVNAPGVNTNDDLFLEGGYFGLEFVR